MNIFYTDKITAADGFKGLLYGPSGVGKTRLIATAPRPFVFSAEKGLLSLRKFKIPYCVINNYKELTDAYLWAMKSNEAKSYDTWCLDSLSEMAEVVSTEERRKNSDPRKYSPAVADAMYSIIRDFRDTKQKHIVCIAKQIIVETGTAPLIVKCAIPIMPGEKLQNNLPYFWDGVFHMFNGTTPEGKTWEALHTRASPQWQAKDRSGNLDDIEYPDLGAIFKKACS